MTETKMCKAIWSDRPVNCMLSNGNRAAREEPLRLKHKQFACCLSTCGASWMQGSEWQIRDYCPRAAL